MRYADVMDREMSTLGGGLIGDGLERPSQCDRNLSRVEVCQEGKLVFRTVTDPRGAGLCDEFVEVAEDGPPLAFGESGLGTD